MLSTLNMVFLKASGKKHTVRIADALDVQDPVKVKALMDFIVANSVFEIPDDPIVSAFEAKVQNVTDTMVELV